MTDDPVASAANPATPLTTSRRAERIRDALLPDQAFEEEIAEALGCSRRTVQRLDFPYVRAGIRRIYSLPESREALRHRPARNTSAPRNKRQAI